MEPVNIQTEMVAVYGQVSVTLRTSGAIHQQTNIFKINSMVQKDMYY